MFVVIRSVGIVLLSFMLLCLGHGLLSSLVSIRAAVENFSNIWIGLMGFAYFGGFLVGIFVCAELLKRVGHIRTFAGLASITSAIAIVFLLAVYPLSWVMFRFFYGICIASLYMVIESWLNSVSAKEIRAQVLSIYMIVIYSAFAFSQIMLNVSSFDSYIQFLVVSILLSFSVVPLCLSPKAQAIDVPIETYPFHKLIRLSPFGSLSCLTGGLVVGSIWSLLGAYLQQMHIPPSHVILYLAVTFVGALLFQYPLGKLVDKSENKRKVILWACLLGVGSNSVLFFVLFFSHSPISLSLLFMILGGTSFPIYSLSMALILDFVPSKYTVKASGSLLFINGFGSMMGALICSILMSFIGPSAFILFCILCLAINASAYFWLNAADPMFPEDISFVAVPRTTVMLHEFDPRLETTGATNVDHSSSPP